MDELFESTKQEIKSNIDNIKSELNSNYRNIQSDIQKLDSSKPTLYEITTMLSNKADLNSTSINLQSKVDLSEFEVLKINFEKLNRENSNKIDFNKFDEYMMETRNTIDYIQKDLVIKANIKEVFLHLKNKAEIDDVNKALTQIHDELDLKTNQEQVIKFLL